MDESVKKAFDFASESTKQLITLSTAILTLTITFSKDVFQNVDVWTKDILAYAWIVYLASIMFGILTLLALTGTLDPIKRKSRRRKSVEDAGESDTAVEQSAAHSSGTVSSVLPSIQGVNIRLLSGLQIILFLIATGLVVKSGTSAIKNLSTSKGDSTTVEASIAEANQAIIGTLLSRDSAALEQYLSPDSVILAGLGQVMSRNEVMNEMHSGDLTFEGIHTEGVRVIKFADNALEVGNCVVKAMLRGKDIGGKYRYGAVFSKVNGSWQVVSFQLTPLETSNRPPASIKPTNKRRHRSVHGKPPRGKIRRRR